MNTVRRALVLAMTIVGAIGWGAPALADDDEHAGHAGHGADSLEIEPTPVSGESVYQLTSLWTGADGRARPLSELAGRIQLVAMVYTHCEHACPRIIADMRRIRSDLGDTGERVGFVLASLDPDRDDAERLSVFAERTGLGEPWVLLRADASSVRELAAVLGVRYRRVSEQDFVHSNLITVLDPQGRIVHRQVGLGVDPDQTVAAIEALLAKEAAPSDAGNAQGPAAE